MPADLVKSFASKSGKSVADVEKLWNKAKEQAKEQGKEEDYKYIVGVLKSMLKLENYNIDPTDLLIELVVLCGDTEQVVESMLLKG